MKLWLTVLSALLAFVVGAGDIAKRPQILESANASTVVNPYRFAPTFSLITSGLVRRYNMEEGSGTTTSSSVGSLTLACTGYPSWVSGLIDSYALDFDGANDYCWNDDTSLYQQSAFTVTARFKADGWGGGTYGRVADHNDGFFQWGWSLYITSLNGGSIGFVGYNSTAVYCTGVISLSTEYIVAITYNSGTVNCYYNGVAKGSGSTTVSYQSGRYDFYIGDRFDNDRKFNGVIDDVRYYNRVISSAEAITITSGNG